MCTVDATMPAPSHGALHYTAAREINLKNSISLIYSYGEDRLHLAHQTVVGQIKFVYVCVCARACVRTCVKEE